jgi:Fe-S-cluster-containing dehydrogenase component
MTVDSGETLANNFSDRTTPPSETTRRGFILSSLGSAAFLSAVAALAQKGATAPLVILENANGILVVDPTRCVGCKRCELACTEYNDGKAQPSQSRIRISRNYNFGARGQQAGSSRGMGEYGNFRLVTETCLQCPHPVPCATACPNDAIVLEKATKARMVDPKKCTGCRMCQNACPWEMMTFDAGAGKAGKCFLCAGKPECVEACPAGALQYISWRDLSRANPIRQAALPVAGNHPSASCGSCHPMRKE